jgi:hypothetical protein
MRKAENIALIWDSTTGFEGWFVRIACTDEHVVDSNPPAIGWAEYEIDDSDAEDMIRESLRWEGIEANESKIREAALDRYL